MIGLFEFLWVLLCFLKVGAQDSSGGSSCVTKETCGACIQEPGCAWCALPLQPPNLNGSDTNIPIIRCQLAADLATVCPIEHIVNPLPRLVVVEDKPLNSNKDSDAVQIRPQHIKLKVRRNQEYLINFQYAQANDYPVDLYYLMDLSASMDPHRQKLSILGHRLANAMKNITSNFRLGFGSFVDKTDLPFVSTVPEKLRVPCVLTDPVTRIKKNCARPYSFRNHMSLTEDTDQFTMEVAKAPVSGNLDAPEGGFDAIMQAIVCKEEIGWRPRARHLLVFSTDAGFHLAGDGKLAGIVEPNDGKCHLDSNGLYTHALHYDYPSVSHINKVVRENNINMIFAVVKRHSLVYKELKSRINGADFGVLTGNSSNVVDLVIGVYDKLVDTVTITDDTGPDVEVRYFSSCLGSELRETHECGGIRVGKKIDFQASIKVLDCPKNVENWSKMIEIKPRALNESLLVELEVICGCPCEGASHIGYETHSKLCNSVGNLKCGICGCPPGYYGKNCECDATALSSGSFSEDRSGCFTSSDARECSGNGMCKCGVCDCHKNTAKQEFYYGTFCECNNFSCKRNAGRLCSGHGICDCGECRCNSGWTGPACECLDTNSTCISPLAAIGSELICSGKGICQCGICACQVEPFRYSGKYCEECLSCPGKKCEEYKNCVECQAYKTGKYSEEECKFFCTAFQTTLVDVIAKRVKLEPEDDEDFDEDTSKICRTHDDSGCSIVFKLKYDSYNQLEKVYAQREKECPADVNILAVILGVIGSIVLAGIIMLMIWKCCTEVHDRREYVRFEKERQLAKFDRGDNPLYKPSTSTFRNPTYGQEFGSQ